jgi:glycosyltransferase involved in cell wall biosynthesis
VNELLIVSPVLPYPPLSGGTTHLWHAIQQLAHFYRIRLWVLAREAHAVAWGPLANLCSDVQAFAPTPAPLRPLDPPMATMAWSQPLATALRTNLVPLVQLEFSDLAQYAPLVRSTGAATICTAHNVTFLAQLRRAKQEQSGVVRLRRLVGMVSLWQYELRYLRACNLVITHSPADAAALQCWLPRTKIVYVPSGVQLPTLVAPVTAPHVLFVGNYLHPPNVEGARWLAREVWPLVVQRLPDARLTLAGRDPPPEIRALASAQVAVPGTLESLEAVYRSASVVVAPIFWGSGVRIKILEALAYGLPLVTTQLAAEGIDLHDQQSALFAETPSAFAHAIQGLLTNPEWRVSLGRAGRAVVEHEYAWPQVGRRLAQLYQETEQQRGKYAS